MVHWVKALLHMPDYLSSILETTVEEEKHLPKAAL